MKELDFKSLARQIMPPILMPILRRAYLRLRAARSPERPLDSSRQDVDVYWDPQMAAILETWGEGNVWSEIQLLLASCQGKVLDIACGTGKTMEILSKFSRLDVYGCDISDLLIQKAIERGLNQSHLCVADATSLSYPAKHFEYAYSIGSIEHFTENGIEQFLTQCDRVVNTMSFHQHPISRSGTNEGWIKTFQSYHNNNVAWWLEKYHKTYRSVVVLDSRWEDERSVGKWFVCSN